MGKYKIYEKNFSDKKSAIDELEWKGYFFKKRTGFFKKYYLYQGVNNEGYRIDIHLFEDGYLAVYRIAPWPMGTGYIPQNDDDWIKEKREELQNSDEYEKIYELGYRIIFKPYFGYCLFNFENSYHQNTRENLIDYFPNIQQALNWAKQHPRK